MRLDRFLSNSLKLTRAEIPSILKQGRVLVNGERIKKKDFKIDENKDDIVFDGKKVEYREFIYFMMNKPQNVVCARVDNLDKTVVEMIDTDYKISPIGRLDKDTTGLLLLTNNGSLIHALTNPINHVDKTYYCKVDNDLTDEEMFLFENGIEIKDGDGEFYFTKKATIKRIKYLEYQVTINEGKFHQVKRMFKYFNSEVLELKRLSIGPIALDENLKLGEYRELNDKEINILKNITNVK